MTEQVHILINQNIIFTTLIVIGFVAQRMKLLSEENIDGISKLLVKVILPLMILTVIPSGGTKKELVGMLPFLICAFLMILFLVFIGWVSGTILRIKQPTKNIHTAVVGFPNSGFIGYPLLIAMFPKEAPLVIAVYMIADTSTIWTIGPLLANPNQTKGKIDFTKLISPTTVCLIIGMIMILLNIRPNNVIWDTMTSVGSMSKYLALIYIGADIGRKGFKRLFERPMIFWTVPIKLIVAPICVFFIFRALNVLTPVHLIMLTIMSMLPSMVVICMIAREYGSDDDYASGGLLLTTVASMVTMPLVMWIIQQL